jgi:hypothetical protein
MLPKKLIMNKSIKNLSVCKIIKKHMFETLKSDEYRVNIRRTKFDKTINNCFLPKTLSK